MMIKYHKNSQPDNLEWFCDKRIKLSTIGYKIQPIKFLKNKFAYYPAVTQS